MRQFRRPLAALALALALAAPAVAQLARDSGATLTQEETHAALTGICMEGISPSYKIQWKEFIGADGNTVYETPDRKQNGKFVADVHGNACFAYADTDYEGWSCFSVQRAGRNGFIFRGDEGGVFVTTSVRRNARSCDGADLIG
jgi:hypothetical protein